jgi:uncharacterized protein (UPF0332 family)
VTSDLGTARSRQELDAARLLASRGFGAQAISRSYYAAFYAAEDALRALGETRSKHSGVVAAFGGRVVRTGFDPGTARLLRTLFRRRNEADYGGIAASREEADAAIRDAEHFVATVEAWLESRKR